MSLASRSSVKESSPVDANLLRLAKIFAALLGILLLGSLGYSLIEGWNLLDSAYMTVITVSTVGYAEVQPMSGWGKIFTSLLILSCLITMTSWTAVLTSFIVENDLGGTFAARRQKKMISNLSGHTIVCGSGPIAQAVIERLLWKRQAVVLIDDDEHQVNAIREHNRRLLVVQGKATDECTLADANVMMASTVVAAMENEVDNLLVAITCKDLGNNIRVIARSNDATIGNRMRKANVDEIVSPMQLCGDRIAELVLE